VVAVVRGRSVGIAPDGWLVVHDAARALGVTDSTVIK